MVRFLKRVLKCAMHLILSAPLRTEKDLAPLLMLGTLTNSLMDESPEYPYSYAYYQHQSSRHSTNET